MALRLKKYFRVVGIIWLNQPPSCLGESQGFFLRNRTVNFLKKDYGLGQRK